MEIFIRNRFKQWAVPPGGERYGVEFYGPFPNRRNAVLARNILRRINANTGCYWDTVATTSRVPKKARVLTWPEWVECQGKYWPSRKEALSWAA